MRLFIIFLLFSVGLPAQKIDLSDNFSSLLEQCQLEFLAPLDAGYKDIAIGRNPFQPYDFAIRSRKEKLEIRYLIEPYRPEDPSFEAPHVRCIQKLMHLASNDQEFVMTGVDIDTTSLRENFNADWGKTFFFKPKPYFSQSRHVKMLALFKEGKGIAYIFFLFDEPSRNLDNRIYTLRFLEEGTTQ